MRGIDVKGGSVKARIYEGLRHTALWNFFLKRKNNCTRNAVGGIFTFDNKYTQTHNSVQIECFCVLSLWIGCHMKRAPYHRFDYR